jgi:crotonobetainyl-CoA:carnitine CoA-transferase CaiB-like acyl-CoA transferase
VHIMDDISDDTKVARRHAEITSVVRRRLTARRATMARKHYKAEEIVAKLRQVDILTSQGQSMADAIRQIGVSEVTYYRWGKNSAD